MGIMGIGWVRLDLRGVIGEVGIGLGDDYNLEFKLRKNFEEEVINWVKYCWEVKIRFNL